MRDDDKGMTPPFTSCCCFEGSQEPLCTAVGDDRSRRGRSHVREADSLPEVIAQVLKWRVVSEPELRCAAAPDESPETIVHSRAGRFPKFRAIVDGLSCSLRAERFVSWRSRLSAFS